MGKLIRAVYFGLERVPAWGEGDGAGEVEAAEDQAGFRAETSRLVMKSLGVVPGGRAFTIFW